MKIKTPVTYAPSFYGNQEFIEDSEGYMLVLASSSVVDPECIMKELVRAVNVYEIREKALQAALDYLSDQAADLDISEPYENASGELALLLEQLENALQEGQ